MNAGPPRFGLRPRRGLYPGADPDNPTTLGERKTLHYPSTTQFPGRTTYPFARYLTRPSTSQYPSTDTLLRPTSRHRSVTATLRGLGQLVTQRLNFHASRKVVLVGESRLVVLANAGVRPHSHVVRFASNRSTVEFAGRTRPVRFASARRKVIL